MLKRYIACLEVVHAMYPMKQKVIFPYANVELIYSQLQKHSDHKLSQSRSANGANGRAMQVYVIVLFACFPQSNLCSDFKSSLRGHD